MNALCRIKDCLCVHGKNGSCSGAGYSSVLNVLQLDVLLCLVGVDEILSERRYRMRRMAVDRLGVVEDEGAGYQSRRED